MIELTNEQRAELVTRAWEAASPNATGDYKARHSRRCRIALAVHWGESDEQRLVDLALA
jgi:hypothetical protein